MTPDRLKRSESYLGIHFDFHAGYDCKEIGKYVTEEMVQSIIDRVHPDYIQCDCKGHRGIASYPTKAGHPAPGFEKDQLMIWRKVTAENGVGLFMHFSGVWDTEVVTRYPEYAVIQSDGKPSVKNTSFFGPYVDEFLIPQLKELRDVYEVDGLWVDGECWSVEPDYCDMAAEAFKDATGHATQPTDPSDPAYRDLMRVSRENFKRYLDHYVTALHDHDPGYQIASNWAYSSQMPEPVGIDIDYISGDYSLNDSLNAARFEARCMMGQGKPWDLMAWSFAAHRTDNVAGNNTKTAVQLKQEAAGTIMLGGGFQAYWKQKRDGSIHPWTMDIMAEVAEFCRERQEVCHRAEPIPQIALLFAGESFYREHPKAFGNWGVPAIRPLAGTLQNLLESQNSVEVCMSHHLEGRMGDYPLIVVPEWNWLKDSERDELSAYVKNGGNLLLIGHGAAKLFAKELDLEFGGGTGKMTPKFLLHENHMAPFTADYESITFGERATAFGELFQFNDPERGPSIPAAAVSSYGAGTVGAILFPMGDAYLSGATVTSRRFLKSVVDMMFPDPIAKVSGSMYVDVALMRNDGKVCVHLLNTAGPHADPGVHVFDEIPTVGPLTITVKTDEKPNSVVLEPNSKPIDWRFEDGSVVAELPLLEIHEVLVIS